MQIQKRFLEKGGCQVLADWIDLMPDGTFPNQNFVEGVLQCIDSLQVDTNDLEDSRLGQVVQYYAEGLANMPAMRPLAKSITDKWSRIIYQINTKYDPEGEYDCEYRQLQKKLDNVKQVHAANAAHNNNEDDDGREEGGPLRRRKGGKRESDGNGQHIMRSRVGIILPDKNAFDFTVRPESNVDFQDKKQNQDSGKAKLQKTLLQLKKANMKSYSSKGMATVKMDH